MTRSPSTDEVARFRALILDRFGLEYAANRFDFLADLLEQRWSVSGLDGEIYLQQLSRQGAAELGELARRLTVNETFFFRNQSHFAALTERVMPALVARCEAARELNIFSAGCASGEEPYSLAVAAREAIPNIDAWRVEIVGADLSPEMITRAKRGLYSQWSLRATPEALKSRYFTPEDKAFVLSPAVVNMVRFYEHNLLTADPRIWRPATYHLVLCRNVLMYLAPNRAREIVDRIAECLVPGGYLFLGHAETLRGVTQAFQLCQSHETFYYQKRGDAPHASSTTRSKQPYFSAESTTIAVEGATSWIDAIRRSSLRIEQLGEPSGGASSAQGPKGSTSSAWDLNLVLQAMRHERYSDAQALLAALPEEAHDDPDALLLRAVLLINSGSVGEANATCSQLLARDALNAGAHYVLALCCEHAGDQPGAIKHDQAAIYLDPNFAMPHLHLGLMSRRAGDLQSARRALELAIALLAREDAARVLLFGGGFSRESLAALCRAELLAAGAGT